MSNDTRKKVAKRRLTDYLYSILQNFCYGKLCVNCEKHKQVYVATEARARAAASKTNFESCEGLGDDLYELSLKKAKIHHNTCLQVAGLVYSHAKVHMLKFLYEFLYPNLDLKKVELCFSDTDSFALALSEDNLEACVLPEKKSDFYRGYNTWFQRQACDTHWQKWFDIKTSNDPNKKFEPEPCCSLASEYDLRELGKFKIENENVDAFVSLCAKTYICICKNFDTKVSSKGVQKTKNHDRLCIMNFVNVLSEMVDHFGINKGFRYVTDCHGVTSYRQQRRGLPFYYQKRAVLEDGITTEPLYDL